MQDQLFQMLGSTGHHSWQQDVALLTRHDHRCVIALSWHHLGWSALQLRKAHGSGAG